MTSRVWFTKLAMKPRALVDTSTLVSAALRSDSKPHQTMRKILEEWELCACAQTLTELETVLARPRFLKYAPAEALTAFVDLVRSECKMFELSAQEEATVVPRCRDGKDDVFLALAGVAQANVLITSDEDLLALNPWNGIPILTPAQFLARFPD